MNLLVNEKFSLFTYSLPVYTLHMHNIALKHLIQEQIFSENKLQNKPFITKLYKYSALHRHLNFINKMFNYRVLLQNKI